MGSWKDNFPLVIKDEGVRLWERRSRAQVLPTVTANRAQSGPRSGCALPQCFCDQLGPALMTETEQRDPETQSECHDNFSRRKEGQWEMRQGQSGAQLRWGCVQVEDAPTFTVACSGSGLRVGSEASFLSSAFSLYTSASALFKDFWRANFSLFQTSFSEAMMASMLASPLNENLEDCRDQSLLT